MNSRALVTVLSSEWPSTTITSKSLKVWLARSFISMGRYFSSLRVGMMIENDGFSLLFCMLFGYYTHDFELICRLLLIFSYIVNTHGR